jgi:nitrate reductase gamma subunit
MDTWITLARGPFFRIALAICVLGLGYRLAVALWQIYSSWRQAGDRRIPVRAVFKATVKWMLPTHLLRLRPVYGLASLMFHLGILLVPVFFAGHVRLWQASIPVAWPMLGPGLADTLTLAAIAGLLMILLGRLLITASRDLTTSEDVWILLVLLVLAVSGYWAAHPTSSPFGARGMVLVHVLVGDLALILTPLTKIVHCILYPLTQLLSEIGWHFPAASGRHVAVALAKEQEPV